MTPDAEQDAKAFWEAHHANSDATDPAPNQVFVDHAASLAVGTSLDLGCGNGGDALWLADHGWSVRATRVEARPQPAVGPDGVRAVVLDHVVAIERTTA